MSDKDDSTWIDLGDLADVRFYVDSADTPPPKKFFKWRLQPQGQWDARFRIRVAGERK